jgi:hypothetical protein
MHSDESLSKISSSVTSQQPGKTDEAPNFKIDDVEICCLVKDIAHLRG